MKTNTVILTDFDGTVTLTNVLDSLYIKFAGSEHRHIMQRWVRGEISTMEEMESVFETVKATRLEMEAYLDTFEIDPGFKSLLGFCCQNGLPFAIVSDGLRWYIDYILGLHGIEGIKVYASEIIFAEGGFRFEFPYFDPAYPLRSTAKPVIVKEYQRKGLKVVFVGDGLSDVEVAGVADVIYAKDVLLQEAKARGIAVREFGDLNDIVRDL